MNQQFDVVELPLTNPTKETMKKYSIPLQLVQQYAQVIKNFKATQNKGITLEYVVGFLKEKVKSDNLNLIPQATWLLMHLAKIGGAVKMAVELMQEYLANLMVNILKGVESCVVHEFEVTFLDLNVLYILVHGRDVFTETTRRNIQG